MPPAPFFSIRTRNWDKYLAGQTPSRQTTKASIRFRATEKIGLDHRWLYAFTAAATYQLIQFLGMFRSPTSPENEPFRVEIRLTAIPKGCACTSNSIRDPSTAVKDTEGWAWLIGLNVLLTGGDRGGEG